MDLELLRKAEDKKRYGLPLTDEEFQVLEEKWSPEARAKITEDRKATELDLDLGTGEKRDPTKLYCSFCNCIVPAVQATKGTGILRKKIEMEILRVGNRKILQENMKHYSKKIVACPEHAKFIKKINIQEWDPE